MSTSIVIVAGPDLCTGSLGITITTMTADMRSTDYLFFFFWHWLPKLLYSYSYYDIIYVTRSATFWERARRLTHPTEPNQNRNHLSSTPPTTNNLATRVLNEGKIINRDVRFTYIYHKFFNFGKFWYFRLSISL